MVYTGNIFFYLPVKWQSLYSVFSDMIQCATPGEQCWMAGTDTGTGVPMFLSYLTSQCLIYSYIRQNESKQ